MVIVFEQSSQFCHVEIHLHLNRKRVGVTGLGSANDGRGQSVAKQADGKDHQSSKLERRVAGLSFGICSNWSRRARLRLTVCQGESRHSGLLQMNG